MVSAPWGNPSSGHAAGRAAAAAVRTARERVAVGIGAADADEVVFVSCGTEANNWAIEAALARPDFAAGRQLQGGDEGGGGLPHVVSTNVEHPSVAACLQHLVEAGRCTWTQVAVDEEGRVAPEDVAAALTPATALVTVMHANNEVGAVNDIKAIVAACKSAGGDPSGPSTPQPWFHTDAAQSVGKVAVDVVDMGVDLLTIVGHKIGAPKGVGALWVSSQLNGQDGEGGLTPRLIGGGQEGGRRGGTEAVPYVCALGAAVKASVDGMAVAAPRMARLRSQLLTNLDVFLRSAKEDLAITVNGPFEADQRLPHLLSVSVEGVDAATLVNFLGEDVAISAGAACHSAPPASAGGSGADGGEADEYDGVSGVLKALGLSPARARSTVRISVGVSTNDFDVDEGAAVIAEGMLAQLLSPAAPSAAPPVQPEQPLQAPPPPLPPQSKQPPQPPPPTPSRYEQFYEMQQKLESGEMAPPKGGAGLPPGMGLSGGAATGGAAAANGGAFDAEVSQDAEDEGAAEPPTNPFFVGYSQEDLAALLAVHEGMVVPEDKELEAQQESATDQPDDAGPASASMLGGLHDLIVAAAEKADTEKAEETS